MQKTEMAGRNKKSLQGSRDANMYDVSERVSRHTYARMEEAPTSTAEAHPGASHKSQLPGVQEHFEDGPWSLTTSPLTPAQAPRIGQLTEESLWSPTISPPTPQPPCTGQPFEDGTVVRRPPVLAQRTSRCAPTNRRGRTSVRNHLPLTATWSPHATATRTDWPALRRRDRGP